MKTRIDETLECVTVHDCNSDDAHQRLTDILAQTVSRGFRGLSSEFPSGLLVESAIHYLQSNSSTTRREDSAAVPTPVRGWPKLGLAWMLLGRMEYYWSHCASHALVTSSTPEQIVAVTAESSRGQSDGGRKKHFCRALAGDLSASQSSPQQHPQFPSRSTLVEAAVGSCSVGVVSKKTGKFYHTRLLNELPLRRQALAAWVLDVARSGDADSRGVFGNSNGLPHFELDIRGSVQLVSVERGDTSGATARYCMNPNRLHVEPPLRDSGDLAHELASAKGARVFDGGTVLSADGAADTVIIAFGDDKLCGALLLSIRRITNGMIFMGRKKRRTRVDERDGRGGQRGGFGREGTPHGETTPTNNVRFEMLSYKQSEGHRQMVKKLLSFYQNLPPKTLVVKLDGSDVVLAPNAGGSSFREKWRALGRGIIFSAEAALFYHLSKNNKVDCSWVTRMPPSPTVYRFLNSGGYVGTAGDLAKMVHAALELVDKDWSTEDDQSVYATLFVHSSMEEEMSFATSPSRHDDRGSIPKIKLDYCQDIFATLSGFPATAQSAVLQVLSGGNRSSSFFQHTLTGTQPLVAHLPGRDRRFQTFVQNIMRR